VCACVCVRVCVREKEREREYKMLTRLGARHPSNRKLAELVILLQTVIRKNVKKPSADSHMPTCAIQYSDTADAPLLTKPHRYIIDYPALQIHQSLSSARDSSLALTYPALQIHHSLISAEGTSLTYPALQIHHSLFSAEGTSLTSQHYTCKYRNV
jgi:hypothetical protein